MRSHRIFYNTPQQFCCGVLFFISTCMTDVYKFGFAHGVYDLLLNLRNSSSLFTLLSIQKLNRGSFEPRLFYVKNISIKKSSFFLLFLYLFAEDCSENKSYKRAAVKHLPEHSHRKITAESMNPCSEARLFKKQSCN